MGYEIEYSYYTKLSVKSDYIPDLKEDKRFVKTHASIRKAV